MAVQLIIKSPNQQVDDIKVDCDWTWTIEKLKEHLCAVYPTKPTKEQQKIIYGGRLLPDHLLLKEVITRDQTVHIMHLVCPQSTYSSKNLNEPSKAKTEEETAHLMSQPPASNVFNNSVNPDGLRQRVFDPQQYISQMNSFYSQAQLPQATMPTAFTYNAYQLAMLQQTYAQFMAQCFAQGQPVNTYPNWTVSQSVEPQNTPNVQPNVNAPVARAPRLNENEDERFDFLDLVYVFTRMLMLTAVLYFYSTPGRIMLVLSLVTFFCLYRMGFMRSRNAQPNAPAVVNEERNQNSQPESDVGASSTSDGETASSDENQTENEAQSAEDQAIAQAPPNRPSRLEITLVFVKTLFTSLIPDLPLPVDVN